MANATETQAGGLDPDLSQNGHGHKNANTGSAPETRRTANRHTERQTVNKRDTDSESRHETHSDKQGETNGQRRGEREIVFRANTATTTTSKPPPPDPRFFHLFTSSLHRTLVLQLLPSVRSLIMFHTKHTPKNTASLVQSQGKDTCTSTLTVKSTARPCSSPIICAEQFSPFTGPSHNSLVGLPAAGQTEPAILTAAPRVLHRTDECDASAVHKHERRPPRDAQQPLRPPQRRCTQDEAAPCATLLFLPPVQFDPSLSLLPPFFDRWPFCQPRIGAEMCFCGPVFFVCLCMLVLFFFRDPTPHATDFEEGHKRQLSGTLSPPSKNLHRVPNTFVVDFQDSQK